MGASDPFIFPIYELYISNVLTDALKKSKKIAWLGLQHPYKVSNFAVSINPQIETHCFDIAPLGDENYCHKLDLNETGYGERLKNENFDIVTIIRCSCYINDHLSAIKEFKDFLSDNEKIIWFEDLVPYKLPENIDVNQPIENWYNGVQVFKYLKPFTEKFLEENFSVKGKLTISIDRSESEGWHHNQYILSKKI